MFTRMKISLLWILALFLASFNLKASDKEVYLYVLHGQEGEITQNNPNSPGELVMYGVDQSVAFFSYRQDVSGTMIPIKDFIDFWKSGTNFFTAPPTALIVAYSPKGNQFSRNMGRISKPRYNLLEKKLTFEVQWFETRLPKGRMKEVSLLIESKVQINET
jgi:hypothetical protein